MEGFLKQIIGIGTEELYWFPEIIDDEIIKQAYVEYINDGMFDEFEDWWNYRNSFKIERVFVEEIYV